MIDTRPHFVLDSKTGWRAADLKNTGVAPNGCLALQQLPGSVRPLVDAQGSFGGLQAAIGVAVDSENRVYILDGQNCLLKRFDRCQQNFATLPCIGGCGREPRQFSSPRGLAISRRDDIYIADTGNCRVQVFSLGGLALRHVWGPLKVEKKARISVTHSVAAVTHAESSSDCSASLQFPEGTWQPWDVAVSSKNRTYVSDYANGLIHVFDAHGCWRKALDGAGESNPPFVKPTRIALDRDGRIYVLQESLSYVVVLNPDGSFYGTVGRPSDVIGRFCPVAVAVDLNGNLCLNDCIAQKFYFYEPDGHGGWCPATCCHATASAASLIFDLSGKPIFSDGAERACQISTEGPFPTSGYFYSSALDSKIYRCLWHRIVLRGCVPQGTAVRVDTFTAESDKSIDEIENLPESRWATAQIDSGTPNGEWDCLSLSLPGRYLWLRLTLEGDGSSTPVIEKAKVYYPRASSLRFLPAVFREDEVSADFTARFLSIFDTLRERTSVQITDIAHYFDPKATPANPPNVSGRDFLSWLAGWLGLSLHNNWPTAKRRELVRRAHTLFKLRGTPEGLKLMIELYAGVRPRILELFRLRRWLVVDSASLGDSSAILGKGITNRLQVGENSQVGGFQLIDYGNPSLDFFNSYAYQFVVIVPRWPGASDADQIALQDIIDQAKPAHTQAHLRWSEPRFRIGLQSLVGVDTVLAKYPVGMIEGQGSLGYDTVLGSPQESSKRPSFSVGNSSRIGCNAILN